MDIRKSGSLPSQSAPAEHFTGIVRIDPLFQSKPPARAGGAFVTFEPCARSDWHTHPLGQTLIVTFGCGLHQRWGGPIEEIRPGDVVTVGPGEKHWHGASPTTAMTHIAIQESLDGKNVEWMEKVTDEQYGRGACTRPSCGVRACECAVIPVRATQEGQRAREGGERFGSCADRAYARARRCRGRLKHAFALGAGLYGRRNRRKPPVQ
jgi:quercetin dioxygenase-like cupin family protein